MVITAGSSRRPYLQANRRGTTMEWEARKMGIDEVGPGNSDFVLVAKATVGTLVLIASTLVAIFGGVVAAGMIQIV